AASTCSNDVLPEPEGPVIPTSSPAAALKYATSSVETAGRAAGSYEKRTSVATSFDPMTRRMRGGLQAAGRRLDEAHLADEASHRVHLRPELEDAPHLDGLR